MRMFMVCIAVLPEDSAFMRAVTEPLRRRNQQRSELSERFNQIRGMGLAAGSS